jgi:hypothetical protein
MGISRAFRKRIKESVKIQDCSVTAVDEDDDENKPWSVTSSTDPERSYFVVRNSSKCLGTSVSSDSSGFDPESCGKDPCVAFKLSQACRHSFSCGCDDYDHGSTCKHILKIAAITGSWNPAQTSLQLNSQEEVEVSVSADIAFDDVNHSQPIGHDQGDESCDLRDPCVSPEVGNNVTNVASIVEEISGSLDVSLR